MSTALALFVSLILTIGSATVAHAAPCCSGSALMPALITSDSSAQVSARFSQSTVVGSSRVDGSSVFHRDGNDESALNFLSSAAYALSPRWQLHAEVPLSRRYRAIDSAKSASWGVSDVSVGGSFELIEELLYSEIKPRVWLFADVTAPTGKSIYESSDLLGSDIQGRGVWSGTLGAYALKAWQAWDIYTLFEHRRYLQRTVNITGANTQLTLGPTTALDLGAGYNFSAYRIGLSIGPTWDGAIESSANVVQANPKLVWSVGVQASAVLKELWSLTLAYTDQTLVGPTYNASLARAASFSAMRRFD